MYDQKPKIEKTVVVRAGFITKTKQPIKVIQPGYARVDFIKEWKLYCSFRMLAKTRT